MIHSELSSRRLQLLVVCSILLALAFMPIDMSAMPTELHGSYIFSRVALQLPAGLFFLYYTTRPNYRAHKDLVLFLVVSYVNGVNYWVIYKCWVVAQHPFQYEGTVLYTLAAFFLLRMSFRYAVYLVLLSNFSFLLMVSFLPIYGSFGFTKYGLMSAAQFISLLGLFSLEQSFLRSKELSEKLHDLSRTDQLTGLNNRRAYELDGQALLDRACDTQQLLTVFLIDIDHFKPYNDFYGHVQGDEIIRLQADLLRQVFNGDDEVLGRYGGEEFIVIALGMDVTEAHRKASRLNELWHQQAVENPQALRKYLTCSVGVHSQVPARGQTFAALIRAADQALYRAKHLGRDCYVFSQGGDGSEPPA
ncbi:GGDEF domain-containing protein [Reinekea marinisedimentorum]|uniref:diguanylate cyclase n=1 Tax=Reinekea marinisedimentorum TaxID=230495 RepID=A0A4R3IBQ8_9GAMM|nr:GGDEF domain-containing protein [Reinekea marinisedimentorum]TCS44070.1 diguanylate cyclase (GGDEF)-like protein [Reinekea marinisedimentorum]